MLTSLHCLWKAQSVSSSDENIYFLSNESHPQCIVTCDYESTDLLSSSPTVHAVSSHSFHPPPWDMFIICVSLSDPFKRSLLSQYCWGRWKPTTTPAAAAALKKHCFLDHLLSCLLVVAQSSSCSLSDCCHYRPFSWMDSGGHQQVLCLLERNICVRVRGAGCCSRALSHTRMTLKMI